MLHGGKISAYRYSIAGGAGTDTPLAPLRTKMFTPLAFHSQICGREWSEGGADPAAGWQRQHPPQSAPRPRGGREAEAALPGGVGRPLPSQHGRLGVPGRDGRGPHLLLPPPQPSGPVCQGLPGDRTHPHGEAVHAKPVRDTATATIVSPPGGWSACHLL